MSLSPALLLMSPSVLLPLQVLATTTIAGAAVYAALFRSVSVGFPSLSCIPNGDGGGTFADDGFFCYKVFLVAADAEASGSYIHDFSVGSLLVFLFELIYVLPETLQIKPHLVFNIAKVFFIRFPDHFLALYS
jgi:hypothetical protein